MDIIHNQLSNPPLNGVAVTRYVQAKWQVGSSRYLCISALVRNPASSQWEQNGRKLSAKTVQANDLCDDCNSQRCIKQAEQLYGMHKGGRGAEVLQVTWSDPCEVNSEAIQMLSLLRVSDVSLETTGVYAFRQHLNQIQYNVAVGKQETHTIHVAGPPHVPGVTYHCVCCSCSMGCIEPIYPISCGNWYFSRKSSIRVVYKIFTFGLAVCVHM